MSSFMKIAAMFVLASPLALAGCMAGTEEDGLDEELGQTEDALGSPDDCGPPINTPPVYRAPTIPAPRYQAPHYGAPRYLPPVYRSPAYPQPTYQQPSQYPSCSVTTGPDGAPYIPGPTFAGPVYQAPDYPPPGCQSPGSQTIYAGGSGGQPRVTVTVTLD